MHPESAPAPSHKVGWDWPDIVFPTNLPETDGVPLDSSWHRMAIELLLAVIWFHFRDRRDFYAGGNMFVHYSSEQVRNKDFRGPDFYFVWGVERDRLRKYWAVWEEGGKYPNVIIELLSPTTAEVDRTTKKQLYEQTFHTAEYLMYDPEARQLEGWHLTNAHYEPMEKNEHGWIWSRQLELYIGIWEGVFEEQRATWLRFYDVHGKLVLTGRESGEERAQNAEKRAEEVARRAEEEKRRAEEEKRRAEEEKRRADKAEEELARLRARLAELEDHE